MPHTRNILLFPVSILYGLLTGIRNFLYDTGILSSTSFRIPLICVGNLTAGGTGKTPHTEYLAELLGKKYKLATLSRGYKRETSDFRIASPDSTAAEIGDEPLQIYRKFPGIVVAVDKDRVNGVKNILAQKPETEVIILDDGFQHRKIKPGLSILLSDFERPFYNDYMLPYGNLREYKSNVRRADVVIVTKCPKNMNPYQRRLVIKETGKAPFQKIFFTSTSYKAPLPVYDSVDAGSTIDLTKCNGAGVLIVTGIASPKPLRDYLQKFFGEVAELSFPDHHTFTDKDIERITAAFRALRSGKKYIITTGKDAVRLRETSGPDDEIKNSFFYIPAGITFLNDEKEEFDSLILDYVRKNRGNN